MPRFELVNDATLYHYMLYSSSEHMNKIAENLLGLDFNDFRELIESHDLSIKEPEQGKMVPGTAAHAEYLLAHLTRDAEWLGGVHSCRFHGLYAGENLNKFSYGPKVGAALLSLFKAAFAPAESGETAGIPDTDPTFANFASALLPASSSSFSSLPATPETQHGAITMPKTSEVQRYESTTNEAKLTAIADDLLKVDVTTFLKTVELHDISLALAYGSKLLPGTHPHTEYLLAYQAQDVDWLTGIIGCRWNGKYIGKIFINPTRVKTALVSLIKSLVEDMAGDDGYIRKNLGVKNNKAFASLSATLLAVSMPSVAPLPAPPESQQEAPSMPNVATEPIHPQDTPKAVTPPAPTNIPEDFDSRPQAHQVPYLNDDVTFADRESELSLLLNLLESRRTTALRELQYVQSCKRLRKYPGIVAESRGYAETPRGFEEN